MSTATGSRISTICAPSLVSASPLIGAVLARFAPDRKRSSARKSREIEDFAGRRVFPLSDGPGAAQRAAIRSSGSRRVLASFVFGFSLTDLSLAGLWLAGFPAAGGAPTSSSLEK